MKTKVVVKDWNDRLSRAAMPGDAPKEYHSNVIYVAAHDALVSHGFGKAKKKHQAESVYIRSNGFQPKGGKIDRVRKLPDAAVETLEALDVERERLVSLISEINAKERALLAAVYEESKPIRMHEIRGFKA